MTKRPHGAGEWDQRYQSGDLPWDSGEVAADLVETLDELELGSGRALEVGCGTGTNAIAMAQRGFDVIATDIAPRAIAMAGQKSAAAGVAEIRFLVHDILASLPVEPGSMQFVFDRGCFHVLSDVERPQFARRVQRALADGGWWLSLCGNADDLTEGGPPRLTAAHIASVVEPLFEVHDLRRSQFRKVNESASDTFLNWRVLLRRR